MNQEQCFEILEDIQNNLRRHGGKITGKELQPALEVLKKHFEKAIDLTPDEKPVFDLFFGKLAYHDNGKGKYPALAFLLLATEFQKINRIETLKKIGEAAKMLVRELTPRQWEYQEIFLNPLQKINNACRDSESFLNPRLSKTYEYEIKASKLEESEKKTLLEFIRTIAK